MVDRRATGQLLDDLHRERRKRRLQEADWLDSIYKAYLTAIGVGLAIFYLSPLLGNASPSRHAITQIRDHGPAIAGLCIAVALAVGLRSGSRGGPLAVEDADLNHVLLAPIPRSQVLRRVALRQVRGVLYLSGLAGAVAGFLAYLRLPGELWAWFLSATGMAVLSALAGWGCALIASGQHLRRRTVTLLGGGLIAWSVTDVIARITTAPTAQLGRLGLAPLSWSPLAVLGAALALIVPIVGLVTIGAVSLEDLDRRSRLIGPMRFAATVQDLRTVLVLHRELNQETPRARPRWHMPADFGPCWSRDWQSIARWPLNRLGRIVGLGLVAGLALGGVWEGATALLVVASAALFVVGLDVAEGLGQEVDHPERPAGYPRLWGELILAHLVVPTCVSFLVLLPALGVIYVTTGSLTALSVSAMLMVPVALAMATAAAAALTLGTPSADTLLGFGFNELGPLLVFLRQVFPPALVLVALVPFAIAQHGATGQQLTDAVTFLPIGLVVAFGVGGWLRFRTWAHA